MTEFGCAMRRCYSILRRHAAEGEGQTGTFRFCENEYDRAVRVHRASPQLLMRKRPQDFLTCRRLGAPCFLVCAQVPCQTEAATRLFLSRR